jgi:endonuclease YncB( thermonuclease family)
MKPVILILIFIIIVVLAVLVAQFYTYSPSCKDDKGECYQTTLLRVIDGDTIITQEEKSIRFSLASAPEISESGGIEAKEFIESICPVGSIIFIDEDDLQLKGSYERMIAKVYCKGVVLNQSLLVSNLGTIDTIFCKNSEFSGESWAKDCI